MIEIIFFFEPKYAVAIMHTLYTNQWLCNLEEIDPGIRPQYFHKSMPYLQ